jgi:uroporphyrinogen-III synthase
LRAAVADADWLVLASARGAERVAHLIGGPLPEGVRLAAVGPATARSASEHLGPVALVAEGATSEALARELVELVRRERPGRSARAVVAGAAGGRADAELILRDAGLAVRRVDVYRTVPAPPDECKRDLAAEGVEVVLLASPSAVTGLVNRALLPAAARVVTIGPTTSAAAQAAGLRVSAEAGRPNLDGMLEALS